MMNTEQNAAPRLLTPHELAAVIRVFRELRGWSQETLGALCPLSVRTIQRVERGEPSNLDTRRALARAFDIADVDVFNKPYSIPTTENLKKMQEEFDHENLLLDTTVAETGRELGVLFERATMNLSNPAIELKPEPATEFATLIDYLREYRDAAEFYSEVDKLVVFAEIQRHLDALATTGICICYATRETRLVGADWRDTTPWPVTLVYLTACEKGKALPKMAVPKEFGLVKGRYATDARRADSDDQIIIRFAIDSAAFLFWFGL
jgi:transcriptional regulator with XRE-family HTH domain